MDFICILNYIWNFISIFICGVQLYVSINTPLCSKKFRFSIINVQYYTQKETISPSTYYGLYNYTMCLFLLFYTIDPLRTCSHIQRQRIWTRAVHIQRQRIWTRAPIYNVSGFGFTEQGTITELSKYFMHNLCNLVLFWFNSIIYYFRKRTPFLSLSVFYQILFNLFYLYLKYLDKQNSMIYCFVVYNSLFDLNYNLEIRLSVDLIQCPLVFTYLVPFENPLILLSSLLTQVPGDPNITNNLVQ